MNNLREVVTKMSNTGQPLSTKKRWMVINKEIVFDNGIIPYTEDHSGNGIIPILNHLLTEDIHNLTWHNAERMKREHKSIEQELQKLGIHNYYDLIMARWNNWNWIYDLHIYSNKRESIRVIGDYSLYLTSIGDVDKALDPMQWDYMTLCDWKQNDHKIFMRYEVASELTPFGMSVLPTQKLISSISKANIKQ